MLSTNKQERKERPIARGVLDYFPDAIAEIAKVSYIGNAQHNPGEEMHWSKDKSPDHADCIARHLMDRGTLDSDGLRHSAKVAWRALALLQIELEIDAASSQVAEDYSKPHGNDNCRDGRSLADQGFTVTGPTANGMFSVDLAEHEPRGSLPVPLNQDQCSMLNELESYGCTRDVAMVIAAGTTFPEPVYAYNGHVYIAGPMRGYPAFNFPAFDRARDAWLKKGYAVISPADIDRRAGDAEDNSTLQAKFVYRDMFSLLFLKRNGNERNSIVMLDGWEKSTGARAEFMTALWLGLRMRHNAGHIIRTGFNGSSLLNGVQDSLVKGV